MTETTTQCTGEPAETLAMNETVQRRTLGRRGAVLVVAAAGVLETSMVLGGAKLVQDMRAADDPTYVAAIEPGGLHDGDLTAHFGQALSKDNCRTKVSAADVTEVYRQAFGESDAPKLSWREAGDLALYASNRLDASASAIEFGQVQQPMQTVMNVVQDSFRERPTLPFAEMRSTADIIFSDYNIQPIYHAAENNGDATLHEVTLVEADQLENSNEARRSVLMTAFKLQDHPKELLAMSGLKRIAFGDIREIRADQVTVGLARAEEGDIYIDVLQPNASGSVLSHELAHMVHHSLCGAARDVAYMALHGADFRYGKATEQVMERAEGKPFDVLENGLGDELLPVVVRPYGALNEREDVATLLGEEIFSKQLSARLLMDEQADVLRQKAALLLTRLKVAVPAVGEYYIRLVRAAKQYDLVQKSLTK